MGSYLSVVVVAALVVALFFVKKLKSWKRTLALIVSALLCLAIGFGLGVKFDRLIVGSLDVNTGKLIMAIALAVMLPSPFRFNSRVGWVLMAAVIILPLLALSLSFAPLSLSLGLPVLWFALSNLSGTIAEDFFFRRFVQDHLGRFGVTIEIVVTALLFGAVHLGGGIVFATMAFVAGIFYAGAYRVSAGSVWAVVAVHWSVNIVRAVLFGVP